MGRFDHSLDPKRRLTIPAGWRDLMGNPRYVYVIPDPHDRCLDLVSPQEMEAIVAKLRQRGLFDRAATEALRTIGEYSEYLQVDVQGRIRIRDALLAYAGLTEQVTLVGAGIKVQIWLPSDRPAPATVNRERLTAAFSTIGLS
jgi:MraZ protein